MGKDGLKKKKSEKKSCVTINREAERNGKS